MRRIRKVLPLLFATTLIAGAIALTTGLASAAGNCTGNVNKKALCHAQEQVGKKCSWDASQTKTLACARISYEAYRKAGLKGNYLPASGSYNQGIKLGWTVPVKDRKAGDLLYFNELDKGVDRVGIYAGNGKVIIPTGSPTSKNPETVKSTELTPARIKLLSKLAVRPVLADPKIDTIRVNTAIAEKNPTDPCPEPDGDAPEGDEPTDDTETPEGDTAAPEDGTETPEGDTAAPEDGTETPEGDTTPEGDSAPEGGTDASDGETTTSTSGGTTTTTTTTTTNDGTTTTTTTTTGGDPADADPAPEGAATDPAPEAPEGDAGADAPEGDADSETPEGDTDADNPEGDGDSPEGDADGDAGCAETDESTTEEDPGPGDESTTEPADDCVDTDVVDNKIVIIDPSDVLDNKPGVVEPAMPGDGGAGTNSEEEPCDRP
ncbi:NlpC/P60 family protein [Micromonospora sp. NBC_01796]|uniref:NlpC/P60 family protein n=1 Tax=Micromonospora sp. NBC_01796 TaxID=2975987 RepID=UPI002DDA19D6|nr:NlpC/P60 family protein [Micromonospora sp. NBC_01796]WSA88949.1 NlpC/P60 family protein [Micromonospora sp. NBC_01796]